MRLLPERQGLGMSLIRGLGNVGAFVGKLIKPGASETPEADLVASEVCDLSDCGQPSTQVFDSVRVDDGPLFVCSRHAADVRRWVG